MNTEQVIELLETHWCTLEVELVERWGEFAGAYRNVVADLPDKPNRRDLAHMADRLLHLLTRYEYSR